MKIPAFSTSWSGHRYVCAIAAFVLPLLVGIGGVYWSDIDDLGQLSHKAAKLGVNRIERVLKSTHIANYNSASWIDAPVTKSGCCCAKKLQKLRLSGR